MKCTNCGSEIMTGSQFCQTCGAPAQPMQQSYQQPIQNGMQQGIYNQPYQQPYQQQNMGVSNEDAGWGLKILSLLIPLAGLILWLVKKDKEPVAAKTCLIWAGIGVIVNFVLGLLV